MGELKDKYEYWTQMYALLCHNIILSTVRVFFLGILFNCFLAKGFLLRHICFINIILENLNHSHNLKRLSFPSATNELHAEWSIIGSFLLPMVPPVGNYTRNMNILYPGFNNYPSRKNSCKIPSRRIGDKWRFIFSNGLWRSNCRAQVPDSYDEHSYPTYFHWMAWSRRRIDTLRIRWIFNVINLEWLQYFRKEKNLAFL